MAGTHFSGRIGSDDQPTGQDEVSSGTSKKTVIQLLAPSNQRVRMYHLTVGFGGTNNTHTPILVELFRQTSAGTFTGALVLRKLDPSQTHTLRTTASYGATVEPTGDEVIFSERVHPQLGTIKEFNDERAIWIPPDGRLGLVVTAANSVLVAATLLCEE